MRQFAGMFVALGALLQAARRLEWYFFSTFPQIYRRCITLVSRKTVLRSQSGLSMKEAVPGGPGSTSAEVLCEVRNLFHTYPGLLAACSLPLAAAVHWTLPCQCSQTLSINLRNVSPSTTIPDLMRKHGFRLKRVKMSFVVYKPKGFRYIHTLQSDEVETKGLFNISRNGMDAAKFPIASPKGTVTDDAYQAACWKDVPPMLL
jgi:hypothetical protein